MLNKSFWSNDRILWLLQLAVWQGCILSPMLFNLYLNEIPFLLDRGDADPIVLPNGYHLSCLLYADDLVLISQSAEGLENALSILSEYCITKHWLLLVNPKKTKIMIFEKEYRKSTLNKHCCHINRHNIEIVNNYAFIQWKFQSL